MSQISTLGMIGTTYRRGGQEAVARFTLSATDRAAQLQALKAACGFRECVYVATCNRVEVVFVGEHHVTMHTYRQRFFEFFAGAVASHTDAARALHVYGGEGAAEHLFVVAAALDSLNPGEAQILGQVKDAYHDSDALEHVGPVLRLIFSEAFECAKKIRAQTQLGVGTISMVSLAVTALEERLAEYVAPARVVVVGAGEMARQWGGVLARRPRIELLFVNRTFERAALLAQEFGGQAQLLSDFLANPGSHLAAIVTATAAPAPIFAYGFFRLLKQCGTGMPLVVDLAVSRDVDPAAAQSFGVQLYDIDRLAGLAAANRRERESEMARAREMVDEALEHLRRRLVDRELAPLITDLRDHYQATVEKSLEELAAGCLRNLADEEREQLQLWARTLANRMSHWPTVGLKRLAFQHGTDAVAAFVSDVRRLTDKE